LTLERREEGDALEEVRAAYRRQDRRVRKPLLDGSPIIVEPKVCPVSSEVVRVTREHRCQQLEDAQGNTAGVYLFEHGGDGRLARLLVQLNGGDLIRGYRAIDGVGELLG